MMDEDIKLLQRLADDGGMEMEFLELLRDAERYRWLRDGCDTKGSSASHIAANCYGMEWDAKIDAAIQKARTA
jgi:hypothetical protein